jgi:hypothetical protein
MEMRRSAAGGCVLNQSKALKSTSEGRVAATSFDFFVIGEERKLNSGSGILGQDFPRSPADTNKRHLAGLGAAANARVIFKGCGRSRRVRK